ncbi:MAG: hypothetical protein Q4B17_02880 [Lautropia sp.]|nr:hypothetical protein [Lautropia sp.]
MRPSPPIITLLPGALMPGAWLDATDLQARLPAIGAALARGQLRMADVPLPATCLPPRPLDDPAAAPNAWAHLRWLALLPAFASAPPPIGTLAAAARLLPAAAPADDATTAGQLPETGSARHGWLMRPVNFRLTTDSMLMDAELPQSIDESQATHMLDLIRPLLTEEGYDISLLSPTRWLLTSRPGIPGWQLQTSPLESTVGQHIDDYLPQGSDARAFRRLLNEIQMSWYQDALRDDTELPANAVWLEGPLDTRSFDAVNALAASGLRQNDLLWLPRLHRDPGSWLDRLAGLDQHYLAAGGKAFACLLCGEHQARWLYTPDAAASLENWQPASGRGGSNPEGGADPPATASAGSATGGPSQPLGRTATAAPTASGQARQPASLLQLMGELLSPRAAWHALRERLTMARNGRPSLAADARGAHPPRSRDAQMLHTLLSESPEHV